MLLYFGVGLRNDVIIFNDVLISIILCTMTRVWSGALDSYSMVQFLLECIIDIIYHYMVLLYLIEFFFRGRFAGGRTRGCGEGRDWSY